MREGSKVSIRHENDREANLGWRFSDAKVRHGVINLLSLVELCSIETDGLTIHARRRPDWESGKEDRIQFDFDFDYELLA